MCLTLLLSLRVCGLLGQVPWKCDVENEEKIKVETKATIRCYPFEHNQEPPTGSPRADMRIYFAYNIFD